eukprot:266236-Hanusia_phi.AAC.3
MKLELVCRSKGLNCYNAVLLTLFILIVGAKEDIPTGNHPSSLSNLFTRQETKTNPPSAVFLHGCENMEGNNLAVCSTDSQQALVVYNPDPLLAALHETEHEFRLEWQDIERVKISVPNIVKLHQGGKGTGGTTWAAGYILANFIAKHHSTIEDKLPPSFIEILRNRRKKISFEDCNVVELGAGLGLVSIVSGMLGCRALATDGDETVLPFLVKNVRAYSQHMKYPVKVAKLQWGSRRDEQVCLASLGDEFEVSQVDFIMAADVVFGQDPRVWKALLSTMLNLSHQETIIFFAYSCRYDLDAEFVQSLSKYFEIAEVPSEDWHSKYENTFLKVMVKKFTP